MTSRHSPAPGGSRGVIGGKGYTDALRKLYAPLHNTPAPPRVKPGNIVTLTLVPGVRLEVLEVHDHHALLRLANGTAVRVDLERLVVVS